MLPGLSLIRVPTSLAIFWRARLAPGRNAQAHPRRTLSFLIIRFDGLGDVVMTTPLIRELKRSFPQSTCTLVVQNAFRPLLATNPDVDEIIGLRPLQIPWLPEGVRSLVSVMLLYCRRLRGRRFDVVISPRWDVDDCFATLLCSLVDAGSRVGYSEKASPAKQRLNRGFDAAFSTCLSAGPIQHEVLRNLEIVRALGRKVQDNRLEIRLTQQDRERAARLLARIPASTAIVAVGIGAGSASRRWPLECYAKTLTRLTKERRVQAVILCSPSERKEARKLAQLLLHEPIIVSSDHLREACAVLERCHLFIGNDSGCAHLAAAMRCKTIVISRHPSNGDPNHRNSPVRFAPWCECVQVLQPARGLGPCKTACLSLEPHCITAVPVEEVVATAKEMLARDLGRIDTVMLAPYNDDSLAGSKSIAAALKEAPELPGIGRSRP